MSNDDTAGLLFALALTGFHVAITLLALFRARRALRHAGLEGRGDRRTLWRLATLRLIATVVAFTGGLLALLPPLFVVSQYVVLPTTSAGLGAMLVPAWLIWIVATIALDNLALRWLRSAEDATLVRPPA